MNKLGKYQVRRTLGKGAMGIVYEGFDPVIERTVAIKTILPSQLDGAQYAEVMARFKHPRCASSSATCATRDRLRPAMHGIDVVVHAAALKQRGRRRVAAGRPRDPAGVPPCLRAARAWT